MAEILTDFGAVGYRHTGLEQKLEEYLRLGCHVDLPPAKAPDLRRYPQRVDLCRYIVAPCAPFDAVIYSKALVLPQTEGGRQATGRNVMADLQDALETPECLEEENVRFVLSDGLVALSHRHRFRKQCVDEAFSARWGGGDLSTCPRLARDERTQGIKGSAFGREACLYVLEALTGDEGVLLAP